MRKARGLRHRHGIARATGKRASRLALWAHLGSNQERPGYEPGALTD
jgi:hypothetical protein